MSTDEEKEEPIQCEIVQYDEYHYVRNQFTTLKELNNHLDRTCCFSDDYSTWILVEGTNNTRLIEQISKRFHFHRLVEENLSETHDRIKLDVLDEGSLIYLAMQMAYLHPSDDQLTRKQISFVLKEKNFLIQFEEKRDESDSFDVFRLIKEKLKNERSKFRTCKVDYLFNSVLNLIVENYALVMNHLFSAVDPIEKLIWKEFKDEKEEKDDSSRLKFDNETLRSLFQVKHLLLSFRIFCQPLKEMIVKLQKTQDRISMVDPQSTHYRRHYRRKKRVKRINLSANYFFNPNQTERSNRHGEEMKGIFHEYIFIYFKDLHDQIIQLNDRIDQFCDRLASLTVLYFILLDAERNKIMTFLSTVSIIFIPLNFVLSSFSMNFEVMPPLEWSPGYFLVLALVLALGLLLFAFFKWKKML